MFLFGFRLGVIFAEIFGKEHEAWYGLRRVRVTVGGTIKDIKKLIFCSFKSFCR